MKTYTIQTDAFLADDIEAESLDEAIREGFEGESLGITDLASLEKKFARYVKDGGWCRIEEDGEEVVSIGDK